MPVYVHLPYLRLEDQRIPALGGEIAPMEFARFEELDSDWASKTYFTQTAPVFWSIQRDDVSPDEFRSQILPTAMLLYYALLATTRIPYPNPMLSASYIGRDGSVIRQLGIYDRTLLLNQNFFPPVPSEHMQFVVGTATRWAAAHLHYQDEVFAMLEAFSMHAMSDASEYLSVLPLLVSLEGFLIPGRVEGIANELYRRIQKILGDRSPDKKLIKDIYSWRSNIIHGSMDQSMDYTNLLAGLSNTCADTVLASAEWLMTPGGTQQEGEVKRDIHAFKKYLSL